MGKIVLNETQYKRLQNILVENEIYRSLLNEELLMEKTYEINLMKRGGNNNWLKTKDKVTKFKVKNYNKDMVEGEATIKDGNRDEVIPVQFDCKKPDVMDITDDSQIRGSQYRTDEKFKSLIKWYCDGKPNKKDTEKINQGGGGEDSKKEYAYTKIKPFTNKGGVKYSGGNLYFRCEPYTKKSHFKLNNLFYTNEVLQKALITNFCKNKKTSYVQMKAHDMITTDSSKGGLTYFISPKDSVWKWVGKKEEVEIIPQYQAVYKGGGGSENYDTSEFDLYI